MNALIPLYEVIPMMVLASIVALWAGAWLLARRARRRIRELLAATREREA